MNKNLLISLIVITIILVCSFLLEYSSFIWIVIIIINLLFILSISIVWIVKRKNISKKIKASLVLICFLLLGVFINTLLPYKNLNPLNDSSLSITTKIKLLYHTDQSDRKYLKSYVFKKYGDIVNKRDISRLELDKKYFSQYENGELNLNNQEKFYLAMIFHHGQKTSDFKIAYQLASEVIDSKEEIKNATWLKKATYDRLIISQVHSQKYGTQR